MIPRYSREKMASIWTQKNIYRIWFEIEAHACDAQALLGVIPKEAAKEIWEKGTFDVEKIQEIEKTTKHDVIAFLTNLAEYVGESSRHVHQGMTSSDVVDTCFSVQLQQASTLLLEDVDALLEALREKAYASKDMVTIGRSHGVHGEPTTMGLKFARFYAEMRRNRTRLEAAKKEISICAISGAMGTFAHIDPFVQEYVAEKLHLQSESISTQIIPRDRHAMFFVTLGVIASSIENIATEIRHLQRTELYEVEEYFSPGQKGSSAMPHKRNPVLSENLTGLARIVRGYVTPALENVALWHERDISHSSVERMIGPDATITLDFALHRLTHVIQNLVLYPKKMQHNMDLLKGLHCSQNILLELTKAGLSREEAYGIVQRNAMRVWEKGEDFFTLLQQDIDVKNSISQERLVALFDIAPHIKHVDHIFSKVFI